MKSLYNKICLIQSPLGINSVEIPSVGAIPPLGLLALATYIENKFSDLEVEIIDGDLIGLEKAKQKLNELNSEIIGIGIQSCESYSSASELAKTAKELGKIVIAGGEQATNRSTQILRNNSNFDYIISGQGEKALENLIMNFPPHQISGLTFREGNEIQQNNSSRLKLNLLPIPDRKFIDLKVYSERFQQTLESKLTGFQNLTTVRTQDGCLKAIREGICTFCKRDDLLMSGLRRPEIFWQEMEYLENLGIDYAWDISASFTSVGEVYLKKLANSRPNQLKIKFRVYARADDLSNERLVEDLKEIGIGNVLVGFDSGNQDCLDSSNKKTTLKQHRQAARNLRRYNIATYSGFVLGHLSETYESMIDTLNHARELKEILGENLFRITTCSKMQLYPGTIEWQRFLESNPQAKAEFKDKDYIDLRKLTNLYFRDYLKLDPFVADEIVEEIRNLSPIKSGKDMKLNHVVH